MLEVAPPAKPRDEFDDEDAKPNNKRVLITGVLLVILCGAALS